MKFDAAAWLLYLAAAVARAHTPHDVIRSYVTYGTTSFVLSRNSILRTDDDMANFNWTTQIEYLVGQVHVSSAYETDKTVYAISADTIRRSTTGGAHWREVGNMRFCAVVDSDLAGSPTNDFVITSGGAAVAVTADFTVVRSVNGGEFSPIQVGQRSLDSCPVLAAFEEGAVSGPMYLGRQDGRIFESLDNGETWNFRVDLEDPRGLRRIVPYGDGSSFFVLFKRDKIVDVRSDNVKRKLKAPGPGTQKPFPNEPSPPTSISMHTVDGVTSLFVVRANSYSIWRGVGYDPMAPLTRVTWTELGIYATGDFFCCAGSLRQTLEAIKFNEEHFYVAKTVPNSPRVIVGGFSGLFVSEDNGDTWTHIDTVGRHLLGLSIAKMPGGFKMGFCTYSVGCFDALLDTDSLKQGGMATFKSIPPVKGLGLLQEYSVVFYSPTYSVDRLAFRLHRVSPSRPPPPYGADRSTDDFQTLTPIMFPVLNGAPGYFAQDLAFTSDGAIYVCGYNMGIAVSVDTGLTWKSLWRVKGNDWAVLRVVPSANFVDDGIMAALVDPTPETHAEEGDNYIFLSTTSGVDWRKLEKTGRLWTNIAVTVTGGFPIVIGVDTDGVLRVRDATVDDGDRRPFEVLKRTVFNHIRPNGYGRDHLVASPDGQEFSAGFVDGGLIFGEVDYPSLSMQSRRGARPGIFQPETEELQVHFDAMEFPRRIIRNFQHKIAFSPDFDTDNIVFSTSFYSIHVSFDRGLNWREFYKMPHGPGFAVEF